MENVKRELLAAPMLFPYEPEKYWEQLRSIIKEEVQSVTKQAISAPTFDIPGLTYKPLYKIIEVCQLFNISRPTIYDWVKHGKLKPYKIRSRVYFLYNDIQGLLENAALPTAKPA